MRFEFLSLGVSRGLMNKMEETAKCNSLQVTALLLEMVGKALISLLPQLRGRYGMNLSCWMCITCASKCTNSHFHVLCSKCVITKPTGISPLWGWRWRSASFLGSGWAMLSTELWHLGGSDHLWCIPGAGTFLQKHRIVLQHLNVSWASLPALKLSIWSGSLCCKSLKIYHRN